MPIGFGQIAGKGIGRDVTTFFVDKGNFLWTLSGICRYEGRDQNVLRVTAIAHRIPIGGEAAGIGVDGSKPFGDN